MKRFLIFVFILLTCSMYGQVKLKQLERDSIKFSVPTPKDQIIIAGDTSYSQRYIPGLAWLDSLGVSSVQDYYISNDTIYLETSDSIFALVITHPANLDNDPSNEIQVLSGSSGTTSNTVLNLSNGGGTYTITEGSGIDFTSETSAGFTINATDASTTNELQTLTENLSFIDITGSGTATMGITSTKDRPVNRTWHIQEGATLSPWWSDSENSWYLANERFLSVTNTCGLDNVQLFNMGDDFGNIITDSCTFSVIINEGSGVTYGSGYMYFVPYADRSVEVADVVKVRARNNSNVWSTIYNGLINTVNGSGSHRYGWVYLTAPTNTREFEITYYTADALEITDIEYFYERGNSDIPVVFKNRGNILYDDNTFLMGIGDQYYSFGTDGQVLTSDGTATEWLDPIVFDSTGIYNYVDSLDLIYSNELNLLSSETGERVYDTYIENGFMTTGDNFNFTEFINNYRDDFLQVDTLLFDGRDAKFLKNIALPTGNATGIFIEGNNLFIVDKDLDSLFHYIMPNKYNLGSAYKNKAVGISSIGVSIEGLNFTENGKYVWFFEYNAGIKVCELSENYNIETMGAPVTYTPPYLLRYTDLEFYNDGLGAFMTHYDRQVIDQFTMTEPYDFSTVTYDGQLALGFRPWSLQFYNGKLYITSYSTDILKEYSFTGGVIDKNNMVATGRSIPFGPAPCGIHIEDGLIYKSDVSDDKVYIYTNISRDTLKTELYEKLDTSNYYSYSVEIEGNNVDTIRTGIATWLDGNVSYKWCTGDTLYTGWYRHELDFKPTLHDSIKPVFVIADTTSIKNVRLFLKQYQSETFDDSAIQTRIDSVITVVDDHKTTDLDIDPTNEFQDLTFASDIIGLTNSAVTFDLSGYLDNTDNQVFDVATFTGGILSLSLEDDGEATKTFDFDARYLQTEVDGSVTNEGVLSMNTDLANTTFSINSNSSGSVPMYFTEETSVTGNNRAVDLERSGNSITFNLKDADELEGVTISAAADYVLVWDATDSDWKSTTISNLPGDGTGTDDQGLVIVSAAAGTINTENSALGAIDLTSLIQQQVVQESTTVGTGFDLSGYQIVADFNEFTTDAIPEGDEFIIMYDVSGVTHEKIDIDDLATYIGSGELTTVGTGFSLAGYQINADFDAFTSDNTFSDADEVVYLSFTTHKRGTLAGLGAYMQANWGDGTGTDDQAIYYYLSGSTPALRLDGTSTGMEFDAGEGLVSSGFEEGTLDRILYQHDWTEFNVLSSGVTTSDYLLVLDGTDEARMQISYLATLIGGADGNGLWDSGNNNSLMASAITGYVNNYLSFNNATGSTTILYIDDATTDYVGIRTTTQSNGAYLNVGGPTDIAGNTWIDGLLTLGTLSGSPVSLLGVTSGGIVTDDITIGDGLAFSSGNIDIKVPWGRMYRSSSQSSTFAEVIPSVQTISDTDVFTTTGNRIEVDQAGDYEITASGWLSASGDGYYAQLIVRKNGSTTIMRTIAFIESSANDKFSVSVSDIVELSALDEISMYISEISSAGNVTVEEATLTIKKLSD